MRKRLKLLWGDAFEAMREEPVSLFVTLICAVILTPIAIFDKGFEAMWSEGKK